MFALSNQDQAEAVGGRYSTLYYYEMRTEANNNSCWFGVVSGARCGDRHGAIGDLFQMGYLKYDKFFSDKNFHFGFLTPALTEFVPESGRMSARARSSLQWYMCSINSFGMLSPNLVGLK